MVGYKMDESGRKLIKVASVLGCIQGLTWIVLCIICIVLYYQEPEPTLNTYFDFINTYLYIFLFNTHVSAFPDQVFSANVFHAFIWIYLFLDVLWVVISVCNFRQQNLQGKIIKLWCSITAAICLWDFITVVIFGSEYAKCLDYYQSFNLGFEDVVILEAACASGTLIPLVIAAKGFIIWIINIVCIVLVYQIAKQTNTPIIRNIPPNIPATPPSLSDYSWHYKQQQPPAQQNPYAKPVSPTNQNFSFSRPDSYSNQNQRAPVQNEPRNQFEYPPVPEPDYGQRWQQHK